MPRGQPLTGPGGQVSPRGRQEEGQHVFAELWAQPRVGLLGCDANDLYDVFLILTNPTFRKRIFYLDITRYICFNMIFLTRILLIIKSLNNCSFLSPEFSNLLHRLIYIMWKLGHFSISQQFNIFKSFAHKHKLFLSDNFYSPPLLHHIIWYIFTYKIYHILCINYYKFFFLVKLRKWYVNVWSDITIQL